MGWRLLGTIAAGMIGVSLPGCEVGEFTCQSDVQCVGAGASPGVCQPDGYCSFPDTDCPTGQRYGEHSGPGAGQCVGEDATGSTGAASNGGPTGQDSGPGVDSNGPTGGDATSEPPTTGPMVTTNDDATTGEPVDPDLVLWLALERAPKGEVLDSSSYMGDGSCRASSCPAGARGAVGAGALFDGVDDVIVVPHAPWLETTEAFTLAVFVRIGIAPFEHRAVLTKPLGSLTQNTWELYIASQIVNLTMASGGIVHTVQLPWGFEPDQWVHLAGRWDGGTLSLWVDGQVVDSVESPAIEFDDQPVLVGADDDHGTNGPMGYFLGSIDDVRVYRRALTGDEIAALAGG
jgi:hypothetical protein